MPKTCESCRYYTADSAEATCPACAKPLRFTMLPPPDAPEAAHTATPRVPRTGAPGGAGVIWELVVNSPVGLIVLMILGLAASFFLYEWASRDSGSGKSSGGRIKVGMHFSEVGRILDVEPPPKPSYPRMRDNFPADEFGDGRLDYEGHGIKVRVYFVGGYVTSVEETPSKAGPGFHSYQFTMSGP
jgi:hypothetical protein